MEGINRGGTCGKEGLLAWNIFHKTAVNRPWALSHGIPTELTFCSKHFQPTPPHNLLAIRCD